MTWTIIRERASGSVAQKCRSDSVSVCLSTQERDTCAGLERMQTRERYMREIRAESCAEREGLPVDVREALLDVDAVRVVVAERCLAFDPPHYMVAHACSRGEASGERVSSELGDVQCYLVYGALAPIRVSKTMVGSEQAIPKGTSRSTSGVFGN